MKTATHIIALAILLFGLTGLGGASAETPQTREDGVTVIHLDEYNGYFSAAETIAGLKAGEYEFIVTNRSDKLVGFQIQNFKSHKTLDKFPLEPGQTRTSRIQITTDGVRYRCPINPTPWYDLDGISKS